MAASCGEPPSSLQPRSTTISETPHSRRDDDAVDSSSTASTDNSNANGTRTAGGGSVFSNGLPGFLINRRGGGGQQQQQQRVKSTSRSPSRMASLGINLKRVARVSSRNLNNLARSKLYNSFPNLARKDSSQISQQQLQQGYNGEDENIRRVLKAVESDHVVSTSAEDNRNRRTVYLQKSGGNDKFGFTIQSYTFRHSSTGETDRITYVDYVDIDSPAFVAGLRAGDVILGINGRNVQSASHNQLVACIRQSVSLRMVVLFENCVNRIELFTRAMKLERLLADKEFELRTLCCQEERILSGKPPLTELEILASLRTPCPTPRSGSFALPNDYACGRNINNAPASEWIITPPRSSSSGTTTNPSDNNSADHYHRRRCMLIGNNGYSRSSESQSIDSQTGVVPTTVASSIIGDGVSVDNVSFGVEMMLDSASEQEQVEDQPTVNLRPDLQHSAAAWRGRRSATEGDLVDLATAAAAAKSTPITDQSPAIDAAEEREIRTPRASTTTENVALVHVLHVDESPRSSSIDEDDGDTPVVSTPSVTRF